MKTYFMAFATLLWGYTALAQKVALVSLEDRRSLSNSYFGNRCEIEIKTTGDEVRKYKYVRIKSLAKAIDSEGVELLTDKQDRADYAEIGDEKLKIELKNPLRKATSIKEVSGTLDLYNPTEANGAIVKVANFQAKPNVNLLPKKAPLSITFFTKESVEKMAKEQKAERDAKMKQLDPAAREIAAGLMALVEGFGAGMAGENELSFYVNGDISKLVDIKMEDETGKEIRRSGRFISGDHLHTYSYDEKPNPKWRLKILIETSASVKSVPFSLKDIELP
ncbi:hypothetical protein [Runella aurantiaca]|uniref:Uncharacterized protein n=1 Tax=Runella aurantiaca TaxID=2282308 RepID=A0A369IKC8_9BACT|nr:hypothetical protein [Runella aurantiaca]RDB07086.1 hypothetical protein DVG78_03415 [Runella aurantiaca]